MADATEKLVACERAADEVKGSSRKHELPLHNAGAFPDRHDMVAGYVLDLFDQPAGPSDFQTVDLCRRTKAKMQAKIALGNIAPAASHFLYLLVAVRAKRDPSTNCVSIRFGPRQLQ